MSPIGTVAGPFRQAAAVEGERPAGEPAALLQQTLLVDAFDEPQFVKLMESPGLAEPYRLLTERPDHVPQWCSKHWLKAGDRKGGGRRCRAS